MVRVGQEIFLVNFSSNSVDFGYLLTLPIPQDSKADECNVYFFMAEQA